VTKKEKFIKLDTWLVHFVAFDVDSDYSLVDVIILIAELRRRFNVDVSFRRPDVDVRQADRLSHRRVRRRRARSSNPPHDRAAVDPGVPVSGRRHRSTGETRFHERKEERISLSHLWRSVRSTRRRRRRRRRLRRIFASRRRLGLLRRQRVTRCRSCCTWDGGGGGVSGGFISRDRP